jgi:hypothetical protein
MGPTPKCHFDPGLPNWNPKIPKIRTPTTLYAHNFVYKPPIDMRYNNKVVALIESFPTVCGTPPTRKEMRAILDF